TEPLSKVHRPRSGRHFRVSAPTAAVPKRNGEVNAQCTADGAACPVCSAWSNRVHGSYLRFPADVPSGGRRVVLQLRVRRFSCGNSGCARRTFVEQIPGLTRRHSQRTERLRSTLASVGLALAGWAGARIASVLGASVSRSTVLRLVDALPEPEVAALRVVGVDEYATRKGRHYGTVLIDVRRHRCRVSRAGSSTGLLRMSTGWRRTTGSGCWICWPVRRTL
ncbi:transposase family protein, partial [Streptomyces sp. NPDC056910]|uniref:transposase family protein n=1 Tax=Streptomyces sp. NPDC056910 TaxID=3345964 RepID=UPI003699BC4B